MARGSFIKIKFDMSPQLSKFLNERWTSEDSREIMQVVEDELSLGNFRDVWRDFQGVWRPLNVEYQRWKNINYPGAQKWVMTGELLKSLTHPAKLSASGGSFGSKHIDLDTSRVGVIAASYEYRSPAAGGYFHKNNRVRPIWLLIPKHRESIKQKIYKVLRLKLRRAGFR